MTIQAPTRSASSFYSKQIATRRQFVGRALGASGFLAMPALAALPASKTNQAAPEVIAAHLLNRLGYGPRPGDLARVASDPQAWLRAQLHAESAPLPAHLKVGLNESQFIGVDPLLSVRELTRQIASNQQAQNQQAQNQQVPRPQEAQAQVAQPAERLPNNPVGLLVRQHALPAAQSRLLRALESPWQLQEVMVDFWFNHFNVFQGKNLLRVMMGNYEHNAIRPHAMGRFADLLKATAHHPAMLYYLDNWQSVGKGNGRRGLNENYARELMELHTLGVDNGYTQQDVTELARMLTGWTIVPLRQQLADTVMSSTQLSGQDKYATLGFWFNANVHDNEDKLWLGQRVGAAGKQEGDFALDALARHPATARHISFKLVQYFVSDRPSERLVRHLAKEFLANDGQIVPILQSLFDSEEFWSPQTIACKLKTPYHFVLSAIRAGGYIVNNVQPILNALEAQGMPLYGCPTPDGYKNIESAWLNPDGMSRRINFSTLLASNRLGQDGIFGGLDPENLLKQLGPLVNANTRELLQTNSHEPALARAMILAGPGMMRR